MQSLLNGTINFTTNSSYRWHYQWLSWLNANLKYRRLWFNEQRLYQLISTWSSLNKRVGILRLAIISIQRRHSMQWKGLNQILNIGKGNVVPLLAFSNWLPNIAHHRMWTIVQLKYILMIILQYPFRSRSSFPAYLLLSGQSSGNFYLGFLP